MKKKTFGVVMSGLIALFLVLSSCGKAEPVAIQTSPATTTKTAQKIVPKGSAVVMLSNLGSQPIDPLYFVGSPECPLVYALNNAMFENDSATGKLVPALAESWEVSADSLTWTIKLTKKAKFHSGNPVTANDWVYTFNRAWNGRCPPGVTSMVKATYEKVWAEDDYTLKVKTLAPLASFPAQQAIIAGNRIPTVVDSKYNEQVGDAQFGKSPSLSGPFKFVSQTLGEYTQLEAVDECYPRTAYTKNLKFVIVPEATTRLAAVKTGQADVMTEVLGPTIPEAKASSGVKVVSSKETDVTEIIISDYLYPNEPSPLLDLRVRQAMAYAIDRKTIIDKLYYGEAENQVILSAASWSPGADPTFKGFPYDPVKAKALLKEAGYPNGFKYKFVARPMHMDVATAVAGFWTDIGIQVDLQTIEAGVYLRDATEKKLRGGWVTTVPTMPADIAVYYTLFYLPGLTWSWCNDSAIIEKINDMKATMEWNAREKKMQTMSRYITEQLASRIPLIVRNSVYAIGPKVDQFIPGKASVWCYPELLKMKE